MTLPKGWKASNIKKMQKALDQQKKKVVQERVPVDEDIIIPLGIALFFIDISIFIMLSFVTAEQNIKFFIIVIYSIIIIISIYFIFAWYYKKHEMDKNDFATLKTIPNYRLYRTIVFLVPVIFSIIIINYVNVSIINQLLTYIKNNLLFLNLKDFIIRPLETVPGSNWDTFIIFILVLISQIAYAVTLPSLLAKEFNFYLANIHFEKAKNERSNETMNVKKINFFIKALDSYDKYIRKTLKHRINRSKIFSKLIIDSNLNLDREVEEIWQAFQRSDTDKLFPLKKMSELLKDGREDELLVRISKFDMFKESIDSVMSVILVTAAIITLLLPK